jgi:hypothetical protein
MSNLKMDVILGKSTNRDDFPTESSLVLPLL